MTALQKITPCLWFDSEAEEAARFYVSVFKDARIGRISRHGKEGFEIHGRPEGSGNDCGVRRPLLGETLRRWRNPAMRLAQGQVRRLLAGISGGLTGDAAGFRQGESGPGDARHARLKKFDIAELRSAYEGK
jgi:hypothetical protein